MYHNKRINRMSNYIDELNDKNSNENTESSEALYEVNLTVFVNASNPLRAVKKAIKEIKDDLYELTYVVTNKETEEKYSIDLAETDGDMVQIILR